MESKSWILLGIILISCGPKWHLERAKYHENLAIAKGAVIASDTVYKNISVYIDKVSKDTVFVSEPGDTVTITKDRLKVRFVDLPGDTVWISGECDTLTIIKQVPIKVEKLIYAPEKGLKTWQWIIIALAAGLIIGVIMKRG